MNATEIVRVDFVQQGTPKTEHTSLQNAAGLLQGWGLYETVEEAARAIMTGQPIVTQLGTRFVLESR